MFSTSSVLASGSLPQPVSETLLRATIPSHALGVYVQEVNASTPLMTWNAQTGFNPASTMKLVTTGAALDMLGPAFTWKTRAYINGVLHGDILEGDLIIKGEGDPKLVTEKFWQFLRKIRAAGIREIRGDLILDRSFYQVKAHDTGAFDGEPFKPYNVGADALLLNFNVLNMHFRPDVTEGKVAIQFDPPLAWSNLQVKVPGLSGMPCRDWQAALQPRFNKEGVSFEGHFPAACGKRNWYVHPYMVAPTDYFGLVFRQLWKEVGGTMKGVVRQGMTPDSAQQIAEWQSPPLPEIVRDINKFSNNVMARHVLLTLAAQYGEVPATPQSGAALLRTWLNNKGINTDSLVIENGSGLSRVERITPLAMGRMLVAAWHSPRMPEFISSMPVVGLDGTMRRRLVYDGVAGRAHIKTGSLDGVLAVAGYVHALSGKRYAVVFFINDAHAEKGQAAQDAFLNWVHENG